ncbi:hypothetical protein AGOR_G00146190 [Albula goreensis]|uniref:peptidylprolyl isomerase n=1 Tax=Albula goreensis TaxID=1534307 RepID=A0A8T3D6L0_9TELE|nr:hypothetical protein AGOR_G00146190 [Albula goreensis]
MAEKKALPSYDECDVVDIGNGPVHSTVDCPSPATADKGQALPMDIREETEVLQSLGVDTDEDPPGLEDAGGGEQREDRGVEEPVTIPSSADEWLDLLGNGQLKKKVLEAEEPSLSFTLGDGDVIQALDLTVQLMGMNEKALVQTNAKYAYGDLGSTTPAVPPVADLTLELQLLEATDASDLGLLTPAKRITLAGQKRERGDYHYQCGDYAFAVNSYNIVLEVSEASSRVDISPQEEEELLDMKVKCLNNMAASQLKLEHHEAALRSCIAVLAHQPDNIKALFRKGKVLALQREYVEAIRILKGALKLEPTNKTIHAELSKMVKRRWSRRAWSRPCTRRCWATPPLGQCRNPRPSHHGVSVGNGSLVPLQLLLVELLYLWP